MKQLSHDEAIRLANVKVAKAAAVSELTADPHRLVYHASPPVHWMNDPNGLIYYKGEYHLYYQHNPNAPQWGDIHWGHMKSKDLLHWEHMPIALAPSEPYDRDGCFSGSAIEHEGQLYVFYTSNVFTTPVGLPDDLLQQQCVAISKDGLMFDKIEQNPVITSPPEDVGQTNHFRDPKVWKHGDSWYMVLGAKKDGRGKVVAYRSNDLLEWSFLGVVTESDGTAGYMHECPDLFHLGGKDVLLLSPEGIGTKDDPWRSGYYIGSFDYETGRLQHGEFHRLDYGFEFYAPQTMDDAQGRRILIGWMPMDGRALNKQWAGCMTIPRELKYHGGNKLQIQPIEEMKLLRKRHIQIENFVVQDGVQSSLPDVAGDCVEMILRFDLAQTDASSFGLQLRASEDGREYTLLQYDTANKQLTFDRTHSGAGAKGVRKCMIEQDSHGILQLHFFIDRSTLEVFVNEGNYVMSGYVFPDSSSQGIRFFANGGHAVLSSVDFWELAL